jgi:PPOX class probable F420-dependent enzyme
MDDELRAFLGGRLIAVLGTSNRDGSLHLTNVWYLLGDGDAVCIQTPDRSVKAKNVVRTGAASLLIDGRGPGPLLRGAMTSGPAELITAPDEVAPIRERIMASYMSAEAMADPRVGGAMRVGANSIIRLSPRRWRTWNVAEMFRGTVQPGYFLPLED